MIKSQICRVGDCVRVKYPYYKGVYGYIHAREESGRWLVKLMEDRTNSAVETILISLEEHEFERVEASIEPID
ncbi:hypothetical protein TUMEXPCC7403_00185 [Tumidithrix helvetica PCC 7403]